MAAGLGTRMRSAVPKHLHPVLGRRMVDWVLVAARSAGADPIVVVAAPQTRDGFEGYEVAVQESRSAPATPCGRRERRSRVGPRTCSSSPATPCCSTPSMLRDLVQAHLDSGAAATVLGIEYDDARSYGRLVRRADGSLERIVEAADATPEELALREANSSIYVFRSDKLWPTLDRIEAHNAQGELYLTDAIELLVGDGEQVAVHLAPEPFEAGRQHARRARRGRRRAARPDQPAPHARRRHDRRPADGLDRARRRDRAGRRRSIPFVELRGRTRIETRRRDPRQLRPRRRRTSDRARRWARSVTFAPAPSSRGLEGRHVRGDQELNHRAADEGAAPLVHRRRRHRRGHEHRRGRDHRELPAPARAAQGTDADRRERQDRHPEWRSSHRWRWETEHGSPPDRRSRRTCLPGALAVARARQENKEGYAARQRND